MAGPRKSKKNDLGTRAIAAHRKQGGKLQVIGTVRLKTRADFALHYTPGVGAVSSYLAEHPEEVSALTIKRNSVAVISDGSAVLGLGNIGPYAALPVMEGKALIFKELAGVDAYPIVLASQDPEKTVETIVNIAPGFGAIHLEDFKAPECFYIEEELKKRLDIPVMHDDQHGTAMVVAAALMNAAKVVRKRFSGLRVVIVGAGAAGTAIAKLLLDAGVRHIVVLDRKGILHHERKDLEGHKRDLAHATSRYHGLAGELIDALPDADVVVGVSGPGSITVSHLELMAPGAIVFAMANPTPEIMPHEARAAGAAIIATGRSDYPNQVNNAMIFPGVFRGALDNGVTEITTDMKLKAAKTLAALVPSPTPRLILPSALDRRVVPVIARAIR